MKTLQTIQTISKIGKIISKIVFICCVVGFCLCVVGIAGLALGVSVMQFGGVSLESLLQHEADMSTGTLYSSVICGAIVCAGQAVLAKFSQRYFERELKDGTPFTLDGARQLLQLGVLSIGIPPVMVMRWTGHSDYQSMKPYIDIAAADKAQAMEQFDKTLEPPEEDEQ